MADKHVVIIKIIRKEDAPKSGTKNGVIELADVDILPAILTNMSEKEIIELIDSGGCFKINL